jgi:hypothetical protein
VGGLPTAKHSDEEEQAYLKHRNSQLFSLMASPAINGHQQATTTHGHKTEAQARTACHAKGMELASVHSESENTHIRQTAHVLHCTHTWLGLRRDKGENVPHNTFKWLDGTHLGYTHWNGGEPNDYFGHNTENCTEMYSFGRWNYIPCTQQNDCWACRKVVSVVGRLEVFHDGTWGSVCDDVFSKNENAANHKGADVACYELGFKRLGIPVIS